jgi:lysophospholipase L1-like esterase
MLKRHSTVGGRGLAIVLAVLAIVIAVPLRTAEGGNKNPDYIGAGDSIGFGRRASDPATTGYVPVLAEYLAAALPPGNASKMPAAARGHYFKTVNLSRLEDETTDDMLAAGGQVEEIEAMLLKHNKNGSRQDDVQVVTFSIGGNDLRTLLADPRCSPSPTPACMPAIAALLGHVSANLNEIMSRIRDAAGPDTVVATMTYYNPFVGVCTLPPALAGAGGAALAGLNGIIQAAAAANGVLVANVAGAGIGVADLFGDCIHPDDSGYAKIAQAFEAVIDPALP